MKKILSLTLAVLMLFSAIPMAYATDVSHDTGTIVTVVGPGGEYSVTVPATLEPGQTGTVTASGYWASNHTLKVTAPETLEVTNAETSQTATINVNFENIESVGNDLEEMNIKADISVDTGNTKFGTWTGTLTYTVELIRPIVAYSYNGIELPALPEWDKNTYPYAFIREAAMNGYVLYCLKNVEYIEHSETTHNIVLTTDNFVYFKTTDENLNETGAWNAYESYDGSVAFQDWIVWSNFTMYNLDGSACIEPSDPVPVYE